MVESISVVIGGIIAGLLGLFGSWIQLRWQWSKEKKRWHNRQDALIKRLTDFQLKADDNDDIKNVSRQRSFQRRSRISIDLLEDHLADSPTDVSEEAWNDFNELRDTVERLQTRKINDDPEQAGRVIRTAQKVVLHAKEFNTHFRLP